MDYIISLVYRDWRGNHSVIDLHVNPMASKPRHNAALDIVERGTGEWDLV